MLDNGADEDAQECAPVTDTGAKVERRKKHRRTNAEGAFYYAVNCKNGFGDDRRTGNRRRSADTGAKVDVGNAATNFIPGEVYEIVYRIVFGSNPDRDFMRLVGFSSRGRPVFEGKEAYHEIDPEWNTILPLSKEKIT